jgi:formylglycine-generating enzyme required for sulfatase activity
MNRILSWLVVSVLCGTAHGVSIEWATVGDPGNAPDNVWPPNIIYVGPDVPQVGAVDYRYRIGKFEISNVQYAEFLNAIAAEDKNELFHPFMDPANVEPDFYPIGGIVQQGSSGEFTYELVPGRENWPVTNVSFWNAIRFANWIHNGQPTGGQDESTTEDGAYTISLGGMADNTITRNPEARVFLPSENEWYKAAFYKGGGTNAGFWEFATGADERPIAENPPGTKSAAYRQTISGTERPLHIVWEPSDVGSYSSSASPVGTFDQAGNASEWNDTILVSFTGNLIRGVRGGHFASEVEWISASGASPDWRNVEIRSPDRHGDDPWSVSFAVGFRVASVYVLPGDFDQSGSLDVVDLDELARVMRTNPCDTWYDLAINGRVDENDRRVWVHDIKGTYFGDANLDGEVNSGDLVDVLGAGEYEDNIEANSGWATGDWNGDGEFTSDDLIVALADGGYEQGPRAAAVPEPGADLLLLTGALAASRRTVPWSLNW